LLTCCDLYYRRKQLCGVTLEATVEEGNPPSGLKNVMKSSCIHMAKISTLDLLKLQIFIIYSYNIQTINILVH
jgi:hypothetical protein